MLYLAAAVRPDESTTHLALLQSSCLGMHMERARPALLVFPLAASDIVSGIYDSSGSNDVLERAGGRQPSGRKLIHPHSAAWPPKSSK